jgi:hypothetical protein
MNHPGPPFSAIPQEIRDEIYEDLVQLSQTLGITGDTASPLSAVSHHIREESLSAFFRVNTIDFTILEIADYVRILAWLDTISDSNVALFRKTNLKSTCDMSPGHPPLRLLSIPSFRGGHLAALLHW